MKKLNALLLYFAALSAFVDASAICYAGSRDEQDAKPVETSRTTFRDAVRRAAPSVVTVVSARPAAQATPDDTDRTITIGIGSGVIVDAAGFIVTSNHLTADATELLVALSDGKPQRTFLVGADVDADLALLKIDVDRPPPIEMGDIGDVAVGDVVLAIGNPRGVGETVTHGIVSAMRRARVGATAVHTLIQTDAAINPGNSGGALVDSAGHLIGINSAIVSVSGGSEGIGFAIPIDLVKDVVANLKKRFDPSTAANHLSKRYEATP